MADFNFSTSTTFMPAVSTAVQEVNSSVIFKQTTATLLITPTFTGTGRTDDPGVPQELGSIITGFTKPAQFSTPRRPSGGQLYPRGNQ